MRLKRVSPPEDSYYINRVKRGDTAAYRFLVERHQKKVYNIVIKIVINTSEAEEVTQDVFLKAYRSLSGFRGTSKFSTWIYRIAFNTAISHHRKRKGVFFESLDELGDTGTENLFTNEELVTEDQLKRLNQAMAVLPPSDQLLLTLYYQQDLSVQEISEISEWSKNNVKIRLHRARKKLYDYFVKHEPGMITKIR